MINRIMKALIVLLSPFITLFFYLNLKDMQFSIPPTYDGDGLLGLISIKTMIETGWVYSNDRLGAPFGTNFLDFAGSDGFNLAIIKSICYFTQDPSSVMNIFCIVSFLLIYFASFWTLRKFHISFWLSIAGALIYACLPYRFYRGPNHLFLAAYFIIPLITASLIEIYSGFSPRKLNPIGKLSLSHYLIFILAGSCGIYYSFFTVLFIFFLGCLNFINLKSKNITKNLLISLLLVLFSVFVNLLPSIFYQHHEGKNFQVAQRAVSEADLYGMRISQLLLPIPDHQIQRVANFSHRYSNGISKTEAISSALGVIVSIGFIYLLYIAVMRKSIFKDIRVELLSKLNLLSILFATVGGLGVLFSLFITSEFRGLNRISIFIAFFSLITFLLGFQKLIESNKKKSRHVGLIPISAFVLLIFALYDQTPKGATDHNQNLNNTFRNDKKFISEIENVLPEEAMIYQLPYIKFPEVSPLNKEGYNGMLKPYVHSKTIHWSFGGIKGRLSDAWLKEIDVIPINKRIDLLQKAGFSGILIDKLACKDQCISLEKEIHSRTKLPAVVSDDKHYSFFRLNPSSKRDIKPELLIAYGSGFYEAEADEHGGKWIWATNQSHLLLYNFTEHTISKIVPLKIETIASKHFRILTINDSTKIDMQIKPREINTIHLKVLLKPGINHIVFDTLKSSVKVGSDSRNLAFRIIF
jgi:phosphoglycerol transferase